ncbi:hypothetical protein TGFOU_403500 [Toxoplasma gondii FOU]|uniref:Uncharacterized protein n=2 Tax=Toxoplasma gondii TaxID=5811 RepID=A0A086LBU4_TOXGO|nr:hypothetical protein TGFOU_403500 [Toxoplasma gondii FOU]PUA90707.1 hypothetical protein TGBR9_248500 [Toxoplasma gondii TgCATBr9]
MAATIPLRPRVAFRLSIRFLFSQEEFPWEEWQRRIDLLRVWLPTLQRTSATATGFPAPSADERSKPVLDKEQEESLVDVLSAQTEAVEATTQSLANTEQDVERLESAVSRRRKGVR